MLPGDKSLAHRALLWSAIEGGTTCLSNVPRSRDCFETLENLKRLGCEVLWTNSHNLVLHSPGFVGFKVGEDFLCKESGTTLRFLLGILSAHSRVRARLHCQPHLRERPHQELIQDLNLLGAQIKTHQTHFEIAPPQIPQVLNLKSNDVSAQRKGSLLFHAYLRRLPLRLESMLSRDHTERMLQAVGVDIEIKKQGESDFIQLGVHHNLKPMRELWLPGDASSAAFVGALPLASKSDSQTLKDILLNPTRTAWVEAYKKMGARIEMTARGKSTMGEFFGDLQISAGDELKNTNLNFGPMGYILDELPLLGALGTFVEGEQTLEGASILRGKESDRIRATVINSRRAGRDVIETPEGWRIWGRKGRPQCQRFLSFQDHRVAIAWSLFGPLDSKESFVKSFGEWESFL